MEPGEKKIKSTGMDLSLSHRSLKSFDASMLWPEAPKKPQQGNNTSQGERGIAVRALDLSHNNITRIVGVQNMQSLSVLDLSNNSLATLDASALPCSLKCLNIAHNALHDLHGLSAAVPKLKELDFSFNRITSQNVSGLPKGLTKVLCQANLIDSTRPFLAILSLSILDLSSNNIMSVDELSRMKELKGLRYLQLRGNPVMDDPDAIPLLLEAVPKLIRLDNTPLSQASENQMLKAHRTRSAKEGQKGFQPRPRSELLSHRSGLRRPESRSESDIEIRLLETKVKELARLVNASEKAEQQLRNQKKILQEQVLTCAGVIDSQALELELLEDKIKELKSEKRALKEPAAELEQTFEQTHASLVARRLNQSFKRI